LHSKYPSGIVPVVFDKIDPGGGVSVGGYDRSFISTIFGVSSAGIGNIGGFSSQIAFGRTLEIAQIGNTGTGMI
jgi:hypothetical protein